MRRCLHSLLVGVLTFSFAVDVASACGRLRSCRPCPPRCVTPLAVGHCGPAWDECGLVVQSDCGFRAVTVVDVCGWSSACGTVVTVAGGWEEIACGAPLDCCGGEIVASAPASVAESAPAVESVVVPPAATTSPVVVAPTPAGTAVPQLKPVEPVAPASATEEATDTSPARESALTIPPAGEPEDVPPARGPDAAEPRTELQPETEPRMEEGDPGVAAEPETTVEPEPSPMPEPEPAPGAEEPAAPVETPEPAPEPNPEPAPPKRSNIFDEEAEETGVAEPVDPAPLDEPAAGAAAGDEEMPDAAVEPDPLPTVEPILDDPLAEPVPADEPAADPADEPVGEPVGEPEAAAAEPMRRWIDATASSAAVGRLVAIRGDSVEILKADGRSVCVPLARLSAFDRDYCAAAGERLVAARGAGPQPGDTAGL